MFPSDTEKEHWKALFRQFSSYVIVGGSGAIIECAALPDLFILHSCHIFGVPLQPL